MKILTEVKCPKCGSLDLPYFDSDEFDAFGPSGKTQTYDRGKGTWRTRCCDEPLPGYEPEYEPEEL